MMCQANAPAVAICYSQGAVNAILHIFSPTISIKLAAPGLQDHTSISAIQRGILSSHHAQNDIPVVQPQPQESLQLVEMPSAEVEGTGAEPPHGQASACASMHSSGLLLQGPLMLACLPQLAMVRALSGLGMPLQTLDVNALRQWVLAAGTTPIANEGLHPSELLEACQGVRIAAHGYGRGW